jgi:hypothetical protein
MSMFEDQHYRWRETYFVLFDSAKRPTLAVVKKTLAALDERYVLVNPHGDAKGQFESMGLVSAEDFAAMDICYTSGDEVTEQVGDLYEEVQRGVPAAQRGTLKRMLEYDARFDVLHFEQLPDPEDQDQDEDMLDPGAVLGVLEALARLVDGVAVDPQSGTVV